MFWLSAAEQGHYAWHDHVVEFIILAPVVSCGVGGGGDEEVAGGGRGTAGADLQLLGERNVYGCSWARTFVRSIQIAPLALMK
jgi:hypothetical protein